MNYVRAVDHDATNDAEQRVIQAIRASWCQETSATPDEWTVDRPSMRQCDVSSFIFWERFGGDLVLGEVLIDGERSEHHYWNRRDGVDLDLTAEQFHGHEVIRELSSLDATQVADARDRINPALRERIAVLNARVEATLEGSLQ